MPTALAKAEARAARVETSPTAWMAEKELPYEDWLRYGSRLGLAGRNANWWLGDWLRFGSARYGAKYAAASRVTGYDRQSLMNMVYVANRFEFSRRRENLSWSHHAELAALDPEAQDSWLERAGEDSMSVRDLREELAASRTADERRSPAPDETSADEPELITCPHCGHHFALDPG